MCRRLVYDLLVKALSPGSAGYCLGHSRSLVYLGAWRSRRELYSWCPATDSILIGLVDSAVRKPRQPTFEWADVAHPRFEILEHSGTAVRLCLDFIGWRVIIVRSIL